MEEEKKRIEQEFKRMINNNFKELSITISYKIENKYKTSFLQEIIDEFNNNNDVYKITMINDPRRIIMFQYKEKSLYKKIKDYLWYDIPISSCRTEYNIPVKLDKK